MKQFSVMIKPASSLCNLRCRYCFYADVSEQREVKSFGVMKTDTVTAMLEHIFVDLDAGDLVTFAFQGGEPTLAGLTYFQNFVDQVKGYKGNVRVNYAMQTNGIVLDDAWLDFLRAHRFLVGLSLDGDAALHNQNRVDGAAKGTFSQVMAAKRRMEAKGVDYNVLCVLTNEAARYPARLWKFIRKEKIQFIQFIPCLGPLDEDDASPWALTAKRFAHFYTGLFPLWLEAIKHGQYVSVKLFDDILNLVLRREETACGMLGNCHPQLVVEADGSFYPCDFFVLDEYRLGNFVDMTVRQAFEANIRSGFARDHQVRPERCHSCSWKSMCNGGCKRMRMGVYVDETGYCGYDDFLNKCFHDLVEAGKRMLAG